MAVQVRGVSGQLKFGYQIVARLHAWHLNNDGRLEAEVSDVNRHWADSGGPFSVVLTVGKKQWIWKDVQLAHLEPSLVAVLPGSPSIR
jgi:hypothetical protein